MNCSKMMMTMVGCVVVSLSMTACGEVSDALEPDRESRVQSISDEACDRSEECGEIGPDKTYETRSECESDMRSRFYDLWPEASCNRGQINDDRYDTCVKRVETFSCDGAGAFFDTLTFGDECDSDAVCIDAPAE